MKRLKQTGYSTHRLARLLLAAALVVVGSAVAWAEASFRGTAPSLVEQGESFHVIYTLVGGEGSDFTPPHVDGAKCVYTHMQTAGYTSSSSVVIINGKKVKSENVSGKTVEYVCTYKASRQGRLSFPPATIKVNGRSMKSNSLTVTVMSTSPQSQAYPPLPSGGPQYDDAFTQSADRDVKPGDLMVRIELNKPRVYEQQAVVCTIKLYTKYQVSKFVPTLQPSFDGFLIEEIPMQPVLNRDEVLNGQKYKVAVLKQCILYPQQSGALTIKSGNYDVNVVQYEIYRALGQAVGRPVERELQVSSNSQTVNVLPLPEPKPESFTGAVGNFKVRTTLPDNLKTYQAATYSYIIEGSGNIKYIKAPQVTMPDQFDVYDPTLKATVNPGGGDMSGTVKVDYTFIPQYVGTFEIPASKFTFFNPETGQYETINIAARKVNVAKGKGEPSNHYRLKHMDVRPIKGGDLDLSHTHRYLVKEWYYWYCYLIPIVLLVALLLFYRKRLRERADESRMRTKRASKVAMRRLKVVRQHLRSGNRNAFYAELLKAMWGYMSDKLTIPVSELSKDNIQAELEAYGVDEQLRAQAIDLLDKCEFAQYAPELADHDMAAVFDQASALIDNLENVKRKKTTDS